MKESGKIILALLLGGVLGNIFVSPVRSNANSLADTAKSELILSQNYPNYRYEVDRYPHNNTQPTNDFKNIIGLTGLLLGTGAIAYNLTRAHKPSWVSSLPGVDKINHNGDLLFRVSPKLRRELLRLVHNPATARRLLSGTLATHPGRNPNWLASKVIYDLKRGR
ncbi:MAG: hypothetical protein AAF652_05730 [Cyanobacteria bacterium P01_C01_bin.72]